MQQNHPYLFILRPIKTTILSRGLYHWDLRQDKRVAILHQAAGRPE